MSVPVVKCDIAMFKRSKPPSILMMSKKEKRTLSSSVVDPYLFYAVCEVSVLVLTLFLSVDSDNMSGVTVYSPFDRGSQITN